MDLGITYIFTDAGIVDVEDDIVIFKLDTIYDTINTQMRIPEKIRQFITKFEESEQSDFINVQLSDRLLSLLENLIVTVPGYCFTHKGYFCVTDNHIFCMDKETKFDIDSSFPLKLLHLITNEFKIISKDEYTIIFTRSNGKKLYAICETSKPVIDNLYKYTEIANFKVNRQEWLDQILEDKRDPVKIELDDNIILLNDCIQIPKDIEMKDHLIVYFRMFYLRKMLKFEQDEFVKFSIKKKQDYYILHAQYEHAEYSLASLLEKE